MGSVGDSVTKFVSDPMNTVDPLGMRNAITGGDGGIAGSKFAELDLTGARAGERALEAQRNATRDANHLQKYMYEQNRSDNEPWRAAGTDALKQMQDPGFQKTFTMADFQADPGYNFRMAEGQKALERSAAAKGGLMSGAFAKAATRFGQDTASSEYANAYNRFNNDSTTRFNRLSSLAGVGQTAQGQNMEMGQNYANTVSNNNLGMANAQASQQMGQLQARNQLLGQGMGAAALAFSDERLKTDITTPSKIDLDEVRQALKPYAFRYVNEAHGVGPWVGVMAQDLAKTKLGKTIVVENADGHLQVDMNKAISLCLAAIAEG